MPTAPVMVGNERKENTPCLPTPRRAAMASARKKIQATRSIDRPEEKHACCTAPGTLRNSTKYSSNNLPSTPRSCHTMINKPDQAATKNLVRPSSLTAQQKRWTTWQPMMHPYQEKRRKNQARNPKSDKDTAVPSEKERIYGIDRLNRDDPAFN